MKNMTATIKMLIVSAFFISILIVGIQQDKQEILTKNQLKEEIEIQKYSENPLLEENKDIAKLGVEIASKTLSYAKSVRQEDEYTVVDVVVANKLCHVTFKNGGDMLLADKIACDGGDYFENRKK